MCEQAQEEQKERERESQADFVLSAQSQTGISISWICEIMTWVEIKSPMLNDWATQVPHVGPNS